MKRMNPGNARSFPTEHAHSGTFPQIRVTFFPCIACLILTLLLLSATVLSEALRRLWGVAAFPTCLLGALQWGKQRMLLSPQVYHSSHSATRAIRFSVSFFTFFTFFTSALAETIVSGEVFGVWDTDGSPYLVTDTLIVPEGDTLLIESGVVVMFQDQDSIRCPFYVHGVLLALGTEADSIYFLSQDSTFPGFVSTDDVEDMIVRFSYCVIDSTETLLELRYPASIALYHSRVRTSEGLYQGCFSADTVSHCDFLSSTNQDAGFVSLWGGPYLFEHNTGPLRIMIDTDDENASIHDNDMIRVTATAPNLEIYNNQLEQIVFDEGVIIMYGNMVSSTCDIEFASGEIYGNRLNSIFFDDCADMEIHGNTILNTLIFPPVDISDSDIELHHNIIVSNQDGIESSYSSADIYQNTIRFGGEGIRLTGSDVVHITGNILFGDGNGPGITVVNGDPPSTSGYNLFHALTQATNGFELDDGNLFTNPFLAGGDPFDYHLQANSPCIDAGDPDSPYDSDGTPADIGCYFYDQSTDNPPIQTIPEDIFAQTGQLLRIEITATDDNGPFDFTFPDLPEWLSEDDELDWVSDTTVVSGTVPEEAVDFSFSVIVEDGEGQTDTSIVFVDVDQRTLLCGEISGILHVEDSPFYVVEDIVVLEGDSLVIEPGCELQFRYVEDEEFQIGIDVYGQLIAEGTVEDSIRFTSELEVSNHSLWKGMNFLDGQYVNRIKYSVIEKAGEAIKLDSSSTLHLRSSRLFDNYMSVYLLGSSQAQVDSCLFVSQVPEFIMYVFLNSSDVEINNSVFWNQYEESPDPSAIRCILSSTALIQGNDFYNCEGIRSDESCRGEVYQNRMHNVPLGISFMNAASGWVSNNLFENHDWEEADGVWITPDLEVLFTNNVFTGFECGVDIVGSSEGENSVQFLNNLFMNDSIAFYNRSIDDTPILYQYNSFWENDTNTINVPWNMLNTTMNPLLEDTLDFRLTDESPLINAGHPDSAYFDCDSSRNDIGLWGGPYGQSYEYPTLVRESCPGIASGFEMLEPYPNPFNSVINITFNVTERTDVRLNVYNILGRQVQSSVLRNLEQGTHRIPLSLTGQSSGVFFVEIKTDHEIQRKRIVLIR